MAIFSGHHNLVQIVRFANRLRTDQRKEQGLPRFSPQSSYRKVPSYKVFYNLLRKIDIDAFAQGLSEWLAQHSGTLPTALALDGKFIRETVGIVCLVDHETDVPHSMAQASQKEGEGEYCELKVAQRMIEEQPDLSHALITADALHCQTHSAQQIGARGGTSSFRPRTTRKRFMSCALPIPNRSAPFCLHSKSPRTDRPA
jgi:hypothetical protein